MEVNSDVFLTTNEIVFGFMNGQRRLAMAYYPATGQTEIVGLSLDSDCRINLDHLPRTGYSFSKYEPCDYGKIFLIFRRGVYTYEESLFLDSKNTSYDVIFLETGDVYKANVKLVPNGVGRQYCLEYFSAERETDFFSREAYGTKFMISK